MLTHQGPLRRSHVLSEGRARRNQLAEEILHDDKRLLEPVALPNGSRLSCGALKEGSFPNLRAPSASSACQAAHVSLPLPWNFGIAHLIRPQREVRGLAPRPSAGP